MDSSNVSILVNGTTSLLITGTSLFINGTLMHENKHERTTSCTAYSQWRNDMPLTMFIVFLFFAGAFLGYGFGAVSGDDGLKLARRVEGHWWDEKVHGMSFEAARHHETGFTLLEQREKVMLERACEQDSFINGKEMEKECGPRLAAPENVKCAMGGPWREPTLFLSS